MSDAAKFLNALQDKIDKHQLVIPQPTVTSLQTEQLIITSQPLENHTSAKLIITPHAAIIGCLCRQITEKLNWIFDFIDIDKFYHDLATELLNSKHNSVKKLLTAVVQKTVHILENYQVSLFVYGTLLPGEINHYLMTQAIFMADEIVPNAELYHAGSYPILIRGKGVVFGKRYQVPLANMEALDKLEEHPDYYCRQILNFNSGEQAWVYVGKKSFVEDLPRIASGNWYKR